MERPAREDLSFSWCAGRMYVYTIGYVVLKRSSSSTCPGGTTRDNEATSVGEASSSVAAIFFEMSAARCFRLKTAASTAASSPIRPTMRS